VIKLRSKVAVCSSRGMPCGPCEIDAVLLKAQRASLRNRQLRIKRSEFECRSTDLRPPCRTAELASGVKQHRLARAAVRTRLAKGVLETISDLPSVVSMGHSRRPQCRKPSVASVLSFVRSDFVQAEPQCCTQDFLRDFYHSATRYLDAEHSLFENLAETETSVTDNSDTHSCSSCAPAKTEYGLSTALSPDIVAFDDEWEVLPVGDCPVVMDAIWSLVE